jgi:hypothetical protein
MKKFGAAAEEAYSCCLALAYYTGDASERISSTCNIIIKLYDGKPESQ